MILNTQWYNVEYVYNDVVDKKQDTTVFKQLTVDHETISVDKGINILSESESKLHNKL